LAKEPSKNWRLSVSRGMSGWFAVLIADFQHEKSGFWYTDVWQTGIGRYATREEAESEARSWAESEGLPYE
jgi:hypothetical protein